jgi:hypothetical protein
MMLPDDRIELVLWRDSYFDLDDEPDQGDYIMGTVGWVREDGRFLRVESEHGPHGPRAITHIPVENVTKRTPLVAAEHPAVVTKLEEAG